MAGTAIFLLSTNCGFCFQKKKKSPAFEFIFIFFSFSMCRWRLHYWVTCINFYTDMFIFSCSESLHTRVHVILQRKTLLCQLSSSSSSGRLKTSKWVWNLMQIIASWLGPKIYWFRFQIVKLIVTKIWNLVNWNCDHWWASLPPLPLPSCSVCWWLDWSRGHRMSWH